MKRKGKFLKSGCLEKKGVDGMDFCEYHYAVGGIDWV
jgi:hypothetical protein